VNQLRRRFSPGAPFLLVLITAIPPAQCETKPASAPPTLYNVALHASFRASSPGEAEWAGLVDGVKDTDTAPGCYRSGNDATFPKTIEIDLGALYTLRQIIIRNSFNGNTKTVIVYYAASSTRWSEGWKFVFPKQLLRDFTYTLPDRPVRYIKLEFPDTYGGGFDGDNIIYLREVEALSTAREPLNLIGDEQRARATRIARSLRMVYHFTSHRSLPPRVVVLCDAAATAPNGLPNFCDLLAQKLQAPGGATSVILPGGKTGNIDYWLRNIENFPELQPAPMYQDSQSPIAAEIIFLCFGWEDQTLGRNEFAYRYRKLLRSLKETTSAAIVGVIPPFPPSQRQAPKPGRVALTEEIIAATKIALDKEECSLLDLHLLSPKVDEVLGIFTGDRLNAEGHAFVAEEMFRLVRPASPTGS